MRRRETLVFLAAFAVVLMGGAALAQVGTFTGSTIDQATMSAPAGNDFNTPTLPETSTLPTDVDEAPAAPTAPDGTVADEPASDRQESNPADEPTEPPATEPEDPADETAPHLAILSPENGQHFDNKTLAFEGTTEPGAQVHAGGYEADVDEAGNWRIVLILSPGGNHVTFKANDHAGNVAEASVEVFYDVPESDEPAPEGKFTAHQKWEVVDGSPAANVYYGTASPGSRVDVGSKYGEGSTVANEAGKWELKVTFPDAPCNEHFKVVVEGDPDGRAEFTVKYACAAEPEFTAHQKMGESTEPWDVFYGTATPGATIWIVSEYGNMETTAGEAGKWDAKLRFSDDLPANQEVGVVVESSDGGRAEFGFFWIVEETEEIDFTANQKYGSCGESIPYDVFWGTATPGATIYVVSPYGDGTTVAGDKGNWEIKVEFPEAPADETFTVVIESSDGGRATFTFFKTGETT